MDFTALLISEVEHAYRPFNGLLNLVDDENLDWQPATGLNWMTMGQLLYHLGDACGVCMQAFEANDWSAIMPEGATPMTAHELPAVDSVAQARERLSADKARALATIAKAGEPRLVNELVAAPWNPQSAPLAQQLLMMVNHLTQHKDQLFYYLKLQGHPVNTMHLYGMA